MIFALSALFLFAADAAELPIRETRVRTFDRFVKELERIDGEGLPARRNRPELWSDTVRKLRQQAESADTPIDFGQVFRRLDATYPNLHAKLVLDEAFDIVAQGGRPTIAASVAAETVNAKQKTFRYRIGTIKTELMSEVRETIRPAIGDEVLAINGRPMSAWSKENFLYCKFPSREQCEMNFFVHFRSAQLSWDWRSPLEYRLRRNERVWTVKIPVKSAPSSSPVPSSIPSEATGDCGVESDRYEGFKPIYKGLNICAFESESFPNVTVLKISSFRYRDLAPDAKISSVKKEVDFFYDGYWKAKAPTTRKLIIDLIDNGGGDTPIEWYTLFYDHPFQEQYVQFRKLPELEDDRIRKDLFYGDVGKEIWFSKLKASGKYQRVKAGAFLPSVPQFCAFEDRDCTEGLFEPRPHGFKGSVRLLVNEWCISSCTGFVWSMKRELGARVKTVGVPDSGDSAYARLFLDVYLDPAAPEGFRVQVEPRTGRTRQNLPAGAFLRQQVAVTRSTDSRGKVVSATPTPVDVWVPYRYRNFDASWESKVFETALKD